MKTNKKSSPVNQTPDPEWVREWQAATPAQRAGLNNVLARIASHRQSAEAEVDALLRETSSGKNLVTLSKHLERTPPSALAMALLIRRVQKLERTAMTRRSAQSKHAEPKAWVQEQWRDRADRDETKKSFSERHARLVSEKFRSQKGTEVKVSAKQILVEWLRDR